MDYYDSPDVFSDENDFLQDCYFSYIAENDSFEIDSNRLEILKPIARGCFGQVYLGRLDGTTKVAVKMVKTNERRFVQNENHEEQRESMRAELKIFAEINGHENFVKLLGAVTTQQKEFCIVLEYCKYEGLDSFLMKRRAQYDDEIVRHQTKTSETQYKVKKSADLAERHATDHHDSIGQLKNRASDHLSIKSSLLKNSIEYVYSALYYLESELDSSWADNYLNRRLANRLTTSDLLAFALQVSQGLEFLHSKKIVHRDLALRNILLAKGFIAKIADFGLSRLTVNNKYYNSHNSKLPFKWLPLEALSSGPTPLNSDLWTFGVLLWEMFTLRCEPYKGLNPKQYKVFIRSGQRLQKPDYAPMEISELMLALWNETPELRPPMAHCQSVIFCELRKSCPPLVEHYGLKNYEFLVQELRYEIPNNCNSTEKLPQAPTKTFNRKQHEDHESIELVPLFGAQDTDANGAPSITDFTTDMQISPRKFDSTSNGDEIRLPKTLNMTDKKKLACSIFRNKLVIIAAGIVLLLVIAAIPIGIFSFKHIYHRTTSNITALSAPDQIQYREGYFSVEVNWKPPLIINNEILGYEIFSPMIRRYLSTSGQWSV